MTDRFGDQTHVKACLAVPKLLRLGGHCLVCASIVNEARSYPDTSRVWEKFTWRHFAVGLLVNSGLTLYYPCGSASCVVSRTSFVVQYCSVAYNSHNLKSSVTQGMAILRFYRCHSKPVWCCYQVDQRITLPSMNHLYSTIHRICKVIDTLHRVQQL